MAGNRRDMDEVVTFGRWVKQRRRALDLTQAGLAAQIGVVTSTIEKIEGELRRPSHETAANLAAALVIPWDKQPAFVSWARGEHQDGIGATLSTVLLHNAAPLERRQALPGALTSFIVREREVASAVAMLRRPDMRLVTLTGPGGIGKTRLGIQIAAMVRDDFPDGVHLIALGTLSDAALLSSTVATA